jgi:hypothetical protein
MPPNPNDSEPAMSPGVSGSLAPAGSSDGPAFQPRSRWRAVAAIICLVLAALLTTPAAIGYWGQRTLNDTQRYVDTLQPLVTSPEVQDVIATKVTDAIEQQVDIEAILDNVFAGVISDRPRLDQLIGPMSAAINGMIDREVRAFVASAEFAELWTRVNSRAQQALQRMLKGEGSGAVSVQGDQVVLDVDEVINQVEDRLAARGLTLVQKVSIPQTDREIVLMEAPQVKQLRTIYAFANPLARWLLPLVALLYLAALMLARRRPRMAVAIGAVLALNALLVALALSIGRQLFSDQLAGTVFAAASRTFFDTLLAYLERGQRVVLALGLVLVVAGWYAGRNRFGTAVRTTVSGGLESTGARLPDGLVGQSGRWVAGKVAWLRVAAVVLGAVVLFWGNSPSPSRFWWSLALVLGLVAALQVLVGAGRAAARSDPAPPPATVAPEAV